MYLQCRHVSLQKRLDIAATEPLSDRIVTTIDLCAPREHVLLDLAVVVSAHIEPITAHMLCDN
jgi:hypothetical protein